MRQELHISSQHNLPISYSVGCSLLYTVHIYAAFQQDTVK